MENSEHVLIEMESLADSLTAKLRSLHPLSKNYSIYRVPEPWRRLYPRDYTPQMVSIGPLHHGKEELKAMEEHKQRHLNYFLQRTRISVACFLKFIKESETKLRNCYAETIHLESDEFITVVLVDAIFLRLYKPDLIADDDRIFRNSLLYAEIEFDILRLENLLPLFILNDLFHLAKTATFGDYYEEISFVEIACSWFRKSTLLSIPVQENLLEIHFSEARHFLDLLIHCLQPSQSHAQINLKHPTIPSAKKLHQAGIRFKSGSSKNLVNLKFKKGILEIPFFTVYEGTELLWRNLLAFENMHGYVGYLSDYIIMIGYLISSPKDAELLFQNEIVGLGDIERLLSVFYNLRKETFIDIDFSYSGIIANPQKHCKIQGNRWKAILRQNYFNTPWASISVIAAVILLLLTITQAVCSIIAL